VYNEPDVDEVVQEEPTETHIQPVPVTIEGPVRVQELPSRVASTRSYILSTTPEQILGADPRRRRALLVGVTNIIWLGTTPNDVTGPYPFALPVGVPIVLEHQAPIYAASATGTATLSMVVENWAD
jgi:hypothetical protein